MGKAVISMLVALALLSAGCLFGDDETDVVLDSEKRSDGTYLVTVREVIGLDGGLEDFAFELRDGDSELRASGKVANQLRNGTVVGIESADTWNARHPGESDTDLGQRAYDVEHEADTCAADETSDGVFPVVFYDLDRDDSISPGDEFVVRGTNYGWGYEAKDSWSLRLVHAPETVLGNPSAGKTVGSVQLVPESFLHQGDNSPVAQFTATKRSDGTFGVQVISISQKLNLEAFQYFLKDTNLNTNATGEIAIQNISGYVVGIESEDSWDVKNPEEDATDFGKLAYDVENEADTCDQDATTNSKFPVVFYDNDRDNKLSSGDQFVIRGVDYNSSYSATSDWMFEIHYDLTGDIIGSKKLP